RGRKFGRAIEESRVAVVIVRARFCDDVDDGSGVSSEFRFEIRRQKAKFLNRVGTRLAADGSADRDLAGVAAVECKVILDAAVAVHADVQTVAEPSLGRRDAGLKQSEVQDLPAVKRKPDDAPLIDGRAERRRFFVDEFDAGRYR